MKQLILELINRDIRKMEMDKNLQPITKLQTNISMNIINRMKEVTHQHTTEYQF
ncbi:hypothetical protein [Mesonia sp. HuA40]|uniref:hypothetical protein n=1 Tax=Mesonia sp. HuA40 TaxID=2602761 RepID=UPI001650BCB1|nr:hypothetical protein [Mesonia sp. HuA40]